jgi:malonate transporter and related proteins
MLQILNIALPFFGLILLGALAPYLWKVEESGLAWLNIFVVWFALPALIFLVVAASPLDQLVNPAFVTATGGVTVFCFLAMVVTGRIVFGADLRMAALQGTSASYGNVGYMGLPLAVAFFGPAAAVPAALVFCIDCTVEFILTAVLAGMGGKKHVSAKEMLCKIAKDIFTHPFIIATALGILASALQVMPGGGLKAILDMLMRAAGPVALFAMGVTVSLRRFSGVGRELPVLAGIKVILQPALTFVAVSWLASPDPVWLQAAVMMAALPTASNAFILARQYDAYIEGSGAAVIVTTVLSVITIPLIVYALQHLV